MEMIRSVPPGGNWQDIPKETVAKSARLKQISNSGGRTTYYGRMRSDAPAYTVNTYFNRPGNGTFIHPEQDRLISLREAARLQSFSDGYRFLGSFSSKLKQIGNAVPPILGNEVGKLVKKGRAIDLFCGAGGLSEGLEMAGHNVVLASDFNGSMCRTYERNHRHTQTVEADLGDDQETALLLEETENVLKGRTLTTLAGGPPCQGFSTAGKWNSADSRNALVFRMIHLVDELRPENIVIENVPGIRWMAKGEIMARIESRLEKLGYYCSAHLLRAEEYGVPQRRRRVFIVASECSESISPPEGVLSHCRTGKTRSEMKTDPTKPPPVNVSEAIGDLPPIPSGGGEEECNYVPLTPLSDYQRYVRGQLTLDGFIVKRLISDTVE
jgi:DNA (cytosine-5)-methyltransferase 1